ncbi:hypothetical protein Tco_1260112, partial [Tanacetum coccineum]
NSEKEKEEKESQEKVEGRKKRKISKAREDKIKRLSNLILKKELLADGTYKTYKFFSDMLSDFDRDDLLVLYRLFNEKYASTRPGFDDLMLWGDMKIMFDLDENGEIWKNHNSQELIEWKLYDSCGVHSLWLREVTIYMLVEKKYPLPQDTLTRMLRWKLHVNYEVSKMAYELIRFIKSQFHQQG